VGDNLAAMSRFQFSVPPRRGPDDGWFRVGTFEVGTTVIVIALAVLSMFVYAFDKTLLAHLDFTAYDVRHGQLWRLATWPVHNEPDIFVVLMFVFFYLFGRDLERAMGRVKMAWFMGVCAVVPAVLGTLIAVASNSRELLLTPAFGLRFVEAGVFVAFIVRYPTARFFFGIPGWVIGAVFIGLDILRFTGDRLWMWVLLELLCVGVAMLGIRTMGFAEEAHWIPKLPIGRAERGPRPAKRRRHDGGDTVVTGPWSGQVPDFVDQEEIDRLLDKVAATGLASLTKDERARLEAASRRKR
jgi:hypothetical protein